MFPETNIVKQLPQISNVYSPSPVQAKQSSQKPIVQLLINTLGKTIIVKIIDISHFSSTQNYTTIHLKSGATYVSSKPVKHYEDLLSANKEFFRIHRSCIVNTMEITSIISDSRKKKYFVTLENGESLELSRQKKDLLLSRFQG